ncbi:MAG TPA: DUF1853 family protein [Myxococcales bacterium]|nr:DUF1853 family protein [Myxococcales bacterium]
MKRVPHTELISCSQYNQFMHDSATWFKAVEAEPKALLDELGRLNSWKVGLRFEALVLFWLTHGSQYTVLGHNLQVHDSGRTLGAFDFIVQSRDGSVEHWELAVKFYLQARVSEEWDAWVGPNGRDRLDLKLNKMVDHQLALSKTAEGRAVLSTLGVNEVRQRAFVKGMFFVPWQGEHAWPTGAEAASSTAFWLRHSELRDYAEKYPDSIFMSHEKPRWLAPGSYDSDIGDNAAQWAAKVSKQEFVRPQMFTQYPVNPASPMSGVQRIFVVADDWPALTK